MIQQTRWTHAGPLALLLVTGSPLAAAPVADFRADSKAADRSLSWNLGPTGMRGCLNSLPGTPERFPGESRLDFLNGGITSTSRQILVIDVGRKPRHWQPHAESVVTNRMADDELLKRLGAIYPESIVDEVFRLCRDRFGGKRKDGARKWRGNRAAAAGTLWSVRDLKTGIE